MGGGRQEQTMEGQNFFICSDENKGIKCLYRFYACIFIITSRPYGIYEFMMGNKLEVVRSKAKLWGSGGEAPAPQLPEAIGGLGVEAPVLGDFLFFN